MAVTVGHGDSARIYPRCTHVDAHGACQIGSTYLVPKGNPEHPGGWDWTVLCTVHFNQWNGDVGHTFPITSTYRLQPVVPHRRRPGSVPREGGR